MGAASKIKFMKYDLSIQHDLNSFKTKVDKLIADKKKVELKAIKQVRTIQQNKYLHVLFTLYGIEVGLTIEESKTLVKRSCPFGTYEKNGNKFLIRTRDLNTQQMTDFIDWFRTWSSQQGIYLPTSEEYIMQKLFIDNEIEKHKQYL